MKDEILECHKVIKVTIDNQNRQVYYVESDGKLCLKPINTIDKIFVHQDDKPSTVKVKKNLSKRTHPEKKRYYVTEVIKVNVHKDDVIFL